MNLYLDTSALVKLYVAEEGSTQVRAGVDAADLASSSAIAYVEARAAFARRRRTGGLSPSEHRQTVRDLDADWEHYLRIELSEVLIREAARLAERHRLRAYDAIHLASAHALRNRLAAPIVFASWVERLERAARRERFTAFR